MNNCVKFHDYEYNPVIIKVATTKKPVVSGIYGFTDTSQNTVGPIGALLSWYMYRLYSILHKIM